MHTIAKLGSLTFGLFALICADVAANEFDNITLYELSRKVSEQTGYIMLFGPKVRTNRKLDVYFSQKVMGKELYQVFLSVLKVHGYVGVRHGNIVRIVSGRKARSSPMPVFGDKRGSG